MTAKKDLSERDICTQFIVPALQKAGWDIARQVREEVFFTDGRIFVKGSRTARGERKRADFILYHRPNIPIAVIEAKDNKQAIGAGMQQALNAGGAAGGISIRRFIMSKIGRNDLCPCGSGQKYKKCCLAKDDSFEALRHEEQRAMQMALEWLLKTYPEEASRALHEDFFADLTEEDDDRLDSLPIGLQDMVRINSIEWMLADAELIIDGEPKRSLDLIFSTGGPLLPARGGAWLKARGEFPMSLYEVREAKPGEGLQVADLLKPDAEPVWVRERSASKSLVRWDVFGARLVCQDGVFTFSGALYPFEREEGLDCRNEILEVIASESPCADDRRILISTTIIDTWLMGLVADDEPLPELVDASTGDKLLLTTDHYRVSDWQEFTRIIDVQEDVDGNREEGWNRFVELEDGRCRCRASMVPKASDSLEVFCRTPGLADEARDWLENIAGGVIKYKIREVVDPRSEKARDAVQQKPEPDIPQELQREIIHQYLAKHYETWPEIPLPALGGKTPLEAVKEKRLRPKVIELLKSIDQLEARRIVQTGGEPFEVSFLWERLGLTR